MYSNHSRYGYDLAKLHFVFLFGITFPKFPFFVTYLCFGWLIWGGKTGDVSVVFYEDFVRQIWFSIFWFIYILKYRLLRVCSILFNSCGCSRWRDKGDCTNESNCLCSDQKCDDPLILIEEIFESMWVSQSLSCGMLLFHFNKSTIRGLGW